MQPKSKSLLFLSTIRRYASSTLQPNSSKSTFPKVVSKPRVLSQNDRARLADIKTKNTKLKEDRPSSEYSNPGLLRNFFQDPRYRYWRRAVLVSPALLLALIHSPYEIMTANGQSMSPFLNPNSADGLPTTDRILVQRWQASPAQHDFQRGKETESHSEYNPDFQRGQIVIFPTPHKPETIAVKRIVAVPGDVVMPLPGYAGGDGPVVIPWNHVWVEGDAGRRSESMDSNWYGPISQNLIVGEVKAVLTSWWKWNWIDWRDHAWPARQADRVEENAITQAAVDPDAVNYSSGWRNGSIALVLERMRKQPDQVLYTFVTDTKIRQETRRLYNNALYVADVATSEQEKKLAKELLEEMEDIYGKEALTFGIRMKRPSRGRGEAVGSDARVFTEENRVSQNTGAVDAERRLRKQGWELERDANGNVKTQGLTAR